MIRLAACALLLPVAAALPTMSACTSTGQTEPNYLSRGRAGRHRVLFYASEKQAPDVKARAFTAQSPSFDISTP
jgi:hypothetical protein